MINTNPITSDSPASQSRYTHKFSRISYDSFGNVSYKCCLSGIAFFYGSHEQTNGTQFPAPSYLSNPQEFGRYRWIEQNNPIKAPSRRSNSASQSASGGYPERNGLIVQPGPETETDNTEWCGRGQGEKVPSPKGILFCRMMPDTNRWTFHSQSEIPEWPQAVYSKKTLTEIAPHHKAYPANASGKR